MGKRLKRMAIACLLLMALLVVGMVLVAFTAHAADKPAPPPKGYVSQEDYDKLQAKYQQAEADLTDALDLCDSYKALADKRLTLLNDALSAADVLRAGITSRDAIIAQQQAKINGLANQFGLVGTFNTDGNYGLGIARKWEYSELSGTYSPNGKTFNLSYTIFF